MSATADIKSIYIENKSRYLRLTDISQIGGEQPYNKVDFSLDYREHPEKYVIGKGQFGVLMYEPYKSEILPYWRYKNEKKAKKSAKKIYSMFEDYLEQSDFVGADMAKKFLHMGNTRSLRYAKYPGGIKYKDGRKVEPIIWADEQKYLASRVFRRYWKKAMKNTKYLRMKAEHQNRSNKIENYMQWP